MTSPWKPNGPSTPEMIAAERDMLRDQNEQLRGDVRELLEALKAFSEMGVGSGPDEEQEVYRIERGAIRKARAAVDKAEGRS